MASSVKPIPCVARVVSAPAPEQASPGDPAHLVIQLRPPDLPSVVAEADELDGIRRERKGRRWARDHRSLTSWALGHVEEGARHGVMNRTRVREILVVGGPIGVARGRLREWYVRRPFRGKGLLHLFVHQVIHTPWPRPGR